MNTNEFSKALDKMRLKFQKSLNNIHIWSSVAIDALLDVQDNEDFLNHRKFSVPSTSTGSVRFVKRKPEQIKEIIDNALDHELYYSVFVYLVAQVEAFINDLLFLILTYDNRRVLTTVQGINFKKQVEVSELIEKSCKEEIIESVIKQNLISVFYASPAKQLEYLCRVCGITIDDALKEDWIEFKASRDLIVHNSGIINELYIEKCGNNARGKVGEKIVIDKCYFDLAVGKAKSLVGKVTSAIQHEIIDKATPVE